MPRRNVPCEVQTKRRHYEIYVKFAKEHKLPIMTIDEWSYWHVRQNESEVRAQHQSRSGQGIQGRKSSGTQQGDSSSADNEAPAEQSADPPRKRRRKAQVRR